MEICTKKSILQKIIIITTVIVIIFNFIAPNISIAGSGGDFAGVLFTPIQSLLLGLGDSVMIVLGNVMTGSKGDQMIYLSTDGSWIKVAVVSVATAAAFVAVTVFTGGTGLIIAAAGAGGALVGAGGCYVVTKVTDEKIMPEYFTIPMFRITPEKIFANKVPFLDANIINPTEYVDANNNTIDTPVYTLKSLISSWYIALRNIAIVIMLSMLIYAGIRILLSSVASSKAKYKQLLMDWLIGMLLIFFMHYIMSFMFTVVNAITDALNTCIQTPAITLNLEKYSSNANAEEKQAIATLGGLDDAGDIEWDAVNIITDFTGLARMKAQFDYSETNTEEHLEDSEVGYMAYSIVYLVLVIYTVMFSYQYLKRLIYIIFLTMIAPLIALMYPIDKMNDGSAQSFNIWIKEFLFTLLIQPLHLLIYMVLVGSAIQLATNNIMYALVVLGFMLPAEKILRKLFGFEKASMGSSVMGGAVGGAIAMNAINALSSRNKNNKTSHSDKSNETGNNKVKMVGAASNRTADSDAKDLVDSLNDVEGDIPIAQNLEGDQSIEDKRREQLEDLNDYYDSEGEDNRFTQPYNNDEWQEMMGEMAGIDSLDQNDSNMNMPIQGNAVQPESTNAITGPSTSTKNKKFRPLKIGRAVIKTGAQGSVKLGKTLIKGYGAATVGMIGVAAGLASDDYSNVLKYGIGGAVAGSAIASGVSNKVVQMPSDAYRKVKAGISQVSKNYHETDTPKEYKEYLNRQSDKAFMKDKEIQMQYKREFEGKEYKVAMEKAMEYRKHGITDNDMIIKAMKANVRGVSKDYDSRERIAAAKFAMNVNNEKDIESMSKRLKQRGIKEQQINKQENLVRKIRGLL